MLETEMKHLIKGLSRSELLTFKKLIDFYLDKVSTDLCSDLRAFYSTIDKRLFKETNKTLQPFTRFALSKKTLYKKLEVIHFELIAWAHTVTKNKSQISTTDKISLYSLFCDLVIKGLRDYQIPVSFNSFINLSGHFYEFFDRAFPSYVASGVASFVLGSKQSEQLNIIYDHDDTIETNNTYKEIYETVICNKPTKRERKKI